MAHEGVYKSRILNGQTALSQSGSTIQVRLFMQVLFLSDVLGASGKNLDAKYLRRRREDECWSNIKFPREKPPRKDFVLWEEALLQVAPGDAS